MRRNCDIEPTRELVEEVARQLATRAMRDSDLPEAIGMQESDNVAIIQEGVNKRVNLKELAKFLGDSFGLDELIEEIEKKIKSLGVRYESTAYWNASSLIPDKGQIIVYSDYKTKEVDGEIVYIPGIKIGSGNAYVQDLAFVDDDLSESLISHINDNIRHITAEERSLWNNKLNVDDNLEVYDGTLIFNRN